MAVPDIEVIVNAPGWAQAVDEAETVCRQACEGAWRAAGSPEIEGAVVVVLADDDEVAALNRHYRDEPGATNVLSFAYAMDRGDEPSVPDAPFGDIVVALETAIAEAQAEAQPVANHLARLVVHGMLHLLGYDHGTDEEAEAMEALELTALASVRAAGDGTPLLALSEHTAGHE